jgi:hypothetical protein
MKIHIKNPFINKNVRSWYNKTNNTYYYCANDICSMLINGTYYQGKNYWKSLKSRNNKFNINNGYISTKIKLPAKDGKLYLYDVIDHKQLVYLIKLISHKNALIFKKWLNLLTKFEQRSHIAEILGSEQRNEIIDIIKNKIGHVIFCRSYIKKWFNISNAVAYDKKKTAL